MPPPRSYQVHAIVIKKTKLGEADRILTFYTREYGRIQGVAKGVRRPSSKMAGHLELLTHSQVALARGRNLDTITGAQTVEAFLPLKNDLWRSSRGLYVTELVNQFTADHVPDESLFELVLGVLRRLCEANGASLLLRYFEMRMFDAAGLRPQLRECVNCHQALQPATNAFSAHAGGALCPVCALKQPFSLDISVNALKVMRFCQDNELEVAIRLRVDTPLSRELEGLTRHYLRYYLERELRSVAWLDELGGQLRETGGSGAAGFESPGRQ